MGLTSARRTGTLLAHGRPPPTVHTMSKGVQSPEALLQTAQEGVLKTSPRQAKSSLLGARLAGFGFRLMRFFSRWKTSPSHIVLASEKLASYLSMLMLL